MSSKALALTVSIIKTVLDEKFSKINPGPDAVIKTAMELVFDDNYAWCCVSDDERFNAAIDASFLFIENEYIKVKITKEMQQIRTVNSMMSGVLVDMDKFTEEYKDFEPIGILKMWGEVKEKLDR